MSNDFEEKRKSNFCTEHSGVCVRLNHVEEDMSEAKKKMDRLILLVVTTLVGVIINLAMFLIKG